MNNKSLVKIFRALSDETRLEIIRLLVSGERCVCELYQALCLSQPKVSRHLAYLRRVGLVINRKVGVWQHYSLNKKMLEKLQLNNILTINKGKREGQTRVCCKKDLLGLEPASEPRGSNQNQHKRRKNFNRDV
jgi:ArsR family transcriptional regulator